MHETQLVRDTAASDPAYPHFIRSLDRSVLKLSIDLLDHELYRDEYESAIISFLTILGINSKEKKFKDSGSYQTKLSAI